MISLTAGSIGNFKLSSLKIKKVTVLVLAFKILETLKNSLKFSSIPSLDGNLIHQKYI